MLGIGAAIALMAAIYFGSHSRGPRVDASAESPRPEPGALHVKESAPVPAVTARTDGTSNSLRELRECINAAHELARAKHLMDCSFYEGKPEYQKALADCMEGPMDAHNRKAAAETVLAHCDVTDLGTRYFEATKEAAKHGDADAQLCYLQGYFFSPEGTNFFTDAELAEYRKVAPDYVDAAFKRGDWRIVQLLDKRHFHPDGNPASLIEGIGQRDTQYRMTKLLRLGASGKYARNLDSELHGFKHPDLQPSAALPPEVTTEGDAWAQETYNNYFSGVPGLTERPVICAQ